MLADRIQADFLLENPSESEGKMSIFVGTAWQFLIIFFFIKLLLVDVLGHIEFDLAGLLNAFFAGQDDWELGLH